MSMIELQKKMMSMTVLPGHECVNRRYAMFEFNLIVKISHDNLLRFTLRCIAYISVLTKLATSI